MKKYDDGMKSCTICNLQHRTKAATILIATFIFSLLTLSTLTFAQDQGFAEDFSDSSVLNYSFFTFGEGDNIPPQIDESGIPRLTGTSIRDLQGSELREHFNTLELNTNGNQVETSIVLTRDTNDPNTFARARVRIQSFSDTEGPEDIQILMEYTVGEENEVRLRARRVIGSTPLDDVESFFSLEDGTTSSRIILPVDATPGIEHLMGITIDTDSRMISYVFDSTTGSVPFNVPAILPATVVRRSIDNFTFVFPDDDGLAVNARSTLRINSVRTEEFDQDFNANAAVLRYSPLFDLNQPAASANIVDGRLRLSLEQPVSIDDRIRNRVRLLEPEIAVTDYLEGTLNLSSTSAVSDGFASLRISGSMYNDQPGGASDGELGDVYVVLGLAVDGEGSLFAFTQTQRANDPAFNTSTIVTDLIDEEFTPEFDTDYIVSITLDRTQSVLQFNLENRESGEAIQSEIEILTTISDPSGGFRNTQVRMESGVIGTVVGFVDNIRTNPAALTSEEMVVNDDAVLVDNNTTILACIDSDGDGFGWNGFATCFPNGVDPLADQPAPDLSHIAVDSPLQCIDTDGDGFGWNGIQTCTPPTPVDEVGDIICIDTDGDGFGWTGSASCIVEADGSITIL